LRDDTVVRFPIPGVIEDPLTELLRDGARRLIAQAVEAELTEFLEQHEQRRDSRGRAAVVRNGHQPERDILTGIGPVSVRVPKVRTRAGESAVFRSSLVPPFVRKARSVEAALPWLYLKGVSSGDMAEALGVLVGPQAKGLSAPVVSRLKQVWQADYEAWRKTSLAKDRWVYVWADGIHSGLRGEAGKLCVLVVIGVNDRGQKRLLAIEDGVRESAQSWREVLLSLRARGLAVAPKLGIGDGALGFWKALDEIYPDTRHQRCWVHKTVNVLNYLPKSLQPKAKKALQDIWMAESRVGAESALALFLETFQAKYPKATECLDKDRDAMLAFYDFPAEHWTHIRSTNVIESAFATIRHRSDRTKGAVSRDTMLTLIFKLGQEAEKSWRRIRGFDHLAKVITGVRFKDGVEVKEEIQQRSRAAA
jgi:putative transposase